MEFTRFALRDSDRFSTPATPALRIRFVFCSAIRAVVDQAHRLRITCGNMRGEVAEPLRERARKAPHRDTDPATEPACSRRSWQRRAADIRQSARRCGRRRSPELLPWSRRCAASRSAYPAPGSDFPARAALCRIHREPAPPTLPDAIASCSAAVSISSPRAQLTIRTPCFMLLKRFALRSSCCVSGVSAMCSVM